MKLETLFVSLLLLLTIGCASPATRGILDAGLGPGNCSRLALAPSHRYLVSADPQRKAITMWCLNEGKPDWTIETAKKMGPIVVELGEWGTPVDLCFAASDTAADACYVLMDTGDGAAVVRVRISGKMSFSLPEKVAEFEGFPTGVTTSVDGKQMVASLSIDLKSLGGIRPAVAFMRIDEDLQWSVDIEEILPQDRFLSTGPICSPVFLGDDSILAVALTLDGKVAARNMTIGAEWFVLHDFDSTSATEQEEIYESYPIALASFESSKGDQLIGIACYRVHANMPDYYSLHFLNLENQELTTIDELSPMGEDSYCIPPISTLTSFKFGDKQVAMLTLPGTNQQYLATAGGDKTSVPPFIATGRLAAGGVVDEAHGVLLTALSGEGRIKMLSFRDREIKAHVRP